MFAVFRVLEPTTKCKLLIHQSARFSCSHHAFRRFEALAVTAERLSNHPNTKQQQQDTHYPRIQPSHLEVKCSEFVSKFQHLKADESSNELVVIRGKVQSVRSAGSRLFFLDIRQGQARTQALCDCIALSSTHDQDKFRECLRQIRRGDIIEIKGSPVRTKASRMNPDGELSIRAHFLPKRLSPSLQVLPDAIDDAETKVRKRHVDLHLNRKLKDTIIFRSHLIQQVREFLLDDGQIEIQTPILAGSAGGASARSFQTRATEFPDRDLHLRIAPELWLKRLVVGGFDGVFEIGPSFRNEGLDPTHNPEFTTCEFYRAYTDLDRLLSLTEEMLSMLAQKARSAQQEQRLCIDVPSFDFNGPYRRLDFVTEVESAANCRLPNLQDEGARDAIVQLFVSKSIPFQKSQTMPQLLDKLAAYYLEPQCQGPTWIINHPECMSPLAKSFIHSSHGQVVSARGELFVKGREIVNTYEEENSPFEQRRKFERQLDARHESSIDLDENYLEVLEWAMPPTGGWGGGIDRLCMLLTGTNRISDVQPFGSLRNIISLSRR